MGEVGSHEGEDTQRGEKIRNRVLRRRGAAECVINKKNNRGRQVRRTKKHLTVALLSINTPRLYKYSLGFINRLYFQFNG